MKRKWIAWGLGALVLLALVVVGGYALYLQLQYERIPDNTALTVENPQTDTLETGKTYTALTWNIGFGSEISFRVDFSLPPKNKVVSQLPTMVSAYRDRFVFIKSFSYDKITIK